MKFTYMAVLALTVLVVGCTKKAPPKPEPVEVRYQVYNFVYQGTPVDDSSYSPLALTVSYQSPTMGKRTNRTYLPDYLYAKDGVISHAEVKDLSSVDYEVAFDIERNKPIHTGQTQVRFVNRKVSPLIFLVGDTTRIDAENSFNFFAVAKPDTTKVEGKNRFYFINTTEGTIGFEVAYAEVVQGNLTQSGIKPESLSKALEVDKSQVEVEVRVKDSTGDMHTCNVGGIKDPSKSVWLLALVHKLESLQTVTRCQGYPL